MRCSIESSTEYSGPQAIDLPPEYIERLERLFDGDAKRLKACLHDMAADGPTAFRVNGLQATWEQVRDELEQVGIEPDRLDGIDGVWTVPSQSHRALTDTPAARDGRIYLMTPSSLLPGLCLEPQPGEEILDLAAAPGGKTLHLADLMENQGRIAAVEAVKPRFHQLRRNLERCGAHIVDTYLADGRGVWRKVPERFDRVLLDAPCSAEGRIVPGEPDSWKYWSPRKIKEMAKKQRRLAESAVHCLKPGGILVYCTCTLAPEENEAIINRLLRRFGDALEIIDLPLAASIPTEAGRTTWAGKSFHEALSLTRRIVPSPPWEGFYLARLRKTASTIPV
ncbi:MAG: RsmB/NOP family class I SAM-dependent RNA methyltransferase [Gemmatimonadetes bacterium]|nr:RsmB/NOP family class I SAM-dependent RNA methyltransferase [Gemmatimonadota bacterium]